MLRVELPQAALAAVNVRCCAMFPRLFALCHVILPLFLNYRDETQRVISSPLTRSLQTALTLFSGTSVPIEVRFRPFVRAAVATLCDIVLARTFYYCVLGLPCACSCAVLQVCGFITERVNPSQADMGRPPGMLKLEFPSVTGFDTLDSEWWPDPGTDGEPMEVKRRCFHESYTHD